MTVSEYLRLWNEAERLMDDFSPHYSVQKDQSRVLFDYAVQLAPGGVIVELGVCHGRTAAMFALAAKSLALNYSGVDFFGIEGTSLAAINDKFQRYKLPGFIQQSSTQAAAKAWELWGDDDPIDLLFVDAGHDEANVKPDCELWLPLVAPGGVAIFHDYDDPYDPASPHWAVRHYADLHTSGWERKISHGMLIARKPK